VKLVKGGKITKGNKKILTIFIALKTFPDFELVSEN
jgi:hypothetical protein